jgi:hypothetical protein
VNRSGAPMTVGSLKNSDTSPPLMSHAQMALTRAASVSDGPTFRWLFGENTMPFFNQVFSMMIIQPLFGWREFSNSGSKNIANH